MIAFLVPIGIDPCDLEQCAEYREAMRRLDYSLKYVAITIRVPQNKLSDQLQGKVPFTYMWRFRRLGPAFKAVLRDVEADRVGAVVVKQPEFVSLLETMRAIGDFVMAQLTATTERRVG